MDKNILDIYNKMQRGRMGITVLTMLTFLVIVLGIGWALLGPVDTMAGMAQEWKEILLLVLGAFIGSYNRVIDYWFNSAERDNKLLEAVDEVDGKDDLHEEEVAEPAPMTKFCDDCGTPYHCSCAEED
jgi:hypothetical protein